jgi:tRNA pseudouridine55 synthase
MLGVTTPSFDLETSVSERYPITHVTPEIIRTAAKKFTGNIWQIPPLYCAKQVHGQRAYDIARQGGTVQLKPVFVNIRKFEIKEVQLPMTEFSVTCGKGTYIRALADDFGKELQCGAVLYSLTRKRIGKYWLSSASEPHLWEEQVSKPTEKRKKRFIVKRKPPAKKTAKKVSANPSAGRAGKKSGKGKKKK